MHEFEPNFVSCVLDCDCLEVNIILCHWHDFLFLLMLIRESGISFDVTQLHPPNIDSNRTCSEGYSQTLHCESLLNLRRRLIDQCEPLASWLVPQLCSVPHRLPRAVVCHRSVSYAVKHSSMPSKRFVLALHNFLMSSRSPLALQARVSVPAVILLVSPPMTCSQALGKGFLECSRDPVMLL